MTSRRVDRLAFGRWFAVLAALLVLGILPVRAFISIGTAGHFTVLADTVTVSGTSTTVLPVAPGGGNGVIGTNNFVQNLPATLTNPAGTTSFGTSAAIGQASASLTGYFVQAITDGVDPTGFTGELGGLTLPPGTYFLSGNAEITAGDLTLEGAGEYLIYALGNLTATPGNDIVLSGAAAGNVHVFATGTANLSGVAFNGMLITGSTISVTDSTVNGKLIATTGSVALNGTVTVNDTGQAPSILVDGSTENRVLFVAPGETVAYQVWAAEPALDSGDVTLSVTGMPAGATHFLDLPQTDNVPSASFGWSATVGTHVITYHAIDATGAVQTLTVTINVGSAPDLGISVIDGGRGGSGGEFDPYLLCAGDGQLVYLVTTSDPDGDLVSLNQSPTGLANLTHDPVLPVGPVASYGALVSFVPDPSQSGLHQITYTATDDSPLAHSATQSIWVNVTVPPKFTSPAQLQTFSVCVGDTVTFDVRLQDADPGQQVDLSVEGVPLGAIHSPNAGGNDYLGFGGGDRLALGNPLATRFTWTPIAADYGVHLLTYTAQDDLLCTTTHQVLISVSQRPSLLVTDEGGSPVTAGQTLTVCPGESLQFAVTATDPDPETVTVTAAGVPANLEHVDPLPLSGNPVTSTATFTPTLAQSGQTLTITYTATDNAAGCSASATVYVRVSSQPVVSATPTGLVVCEGQPISYHVRAGDADPGLVTVGAPVITSAEGAPALQLTSTLLLPAQGNPVEVVLSGTAPNVDADTNYTISHTVTDADGCVVTHFIPVTVRSTVPSVVQLSRQTDGTPFGSEICYSATVFDNCPISEGGPRRVPGVQVLFNITGETGNEGHTLGITDANGVARLCLTPAFPGTLTVVAAIDANGDGTPDPGVSTDSDILTVPPPVRADPGCFASGRGSVHIDLPAFGSEPVIGQFTVDVSPKRNGRYQGKMTLTVPLGNRGARRSIVRIQSTRIDSLTYAEGVGGKTGVLIGKATVKGLAGQGFTGQVSFRVDLLDAGTPGVPTDRFVLSLLNPGTNLLVGPIGGNLTLETTRPNARDDIRLRTGLVR